MTDVTAKVVIYQAFIEGELDVPKHLARRVHDFYFEPQYEDFRPRTLWSLSNAFTSAFMWSAIDRPGCSQTFSTISMLRAYAWSAAPLASNPHPARAPPSRWKFRSPKCGMAR